MVKSRISGKTATYVALEALKRRPIRLLAPDGAQEPPGALVPSGGPDKERKAPPRVRKPSPLHDQCLAPTPDLESHRKRLREAFGNTMSDEFVEVILGKVVEALRPGLLAKLEEPTLNAALALIDSMQPQSELQALLAVQIVATGFSGLQLPQQSQQHMMAAYIEVDGSYAIKLFRLQAEAHYKTCSATVGACQMPTEDFDQFVPDTRVAEELATRRETLWRWDHDPAKAALGWPVRIKIGRLNYRSRHQLEAFKQNLIRHSLHEAASARQKRNARADGHRQRV
jgi:hypothetical protein